MTLALRGPAVGGPLERRVRRHCVPQLLGSLVSGKDRLRVVEADRRRGVFVHDSWDVPDRSKNPCDPILHRAKLLAFCRETCVRDDGAD